MAAADEVGARGVRSMVGFNYRRVPALALARQLVAAGRIGRVRHVRACYLQDWLTDPAAPLTWRLQRDQAGSGALGDLGAHLVDLAQYLTGELITGVSGATTTFVTERRHRGGGGTGPVTVDDAALFTARLGAGRWRPSRRRDSRPAGRTRCGSSSTATAGAWPSTWNGSTSCSSATRPRARWPASAGSWSPSPAIRTCPAGGRPVTCSAGSTRSATRSGIWSPRSRRAEPGAIVPDGLQVQRVLAAVEHSADNGSTWTPVAAGQGGVRSQ